MTDPNENVTSSPVDVIDPEEIDRLFNKDPETLTDEELASMVAYYRSQRQQWAEEERTGTRTTRTKRLAAGTPSKAAVNAALKDLKLEDLL